MTLLPPAMALPTIDQLYAQPDWLALLWEDAVRVHAALALAHPLLETTASGPLSDDVIAAEVRKLEHAAPTAVDAATIVRRALIPAETKVVLGTLKLGMAEMVPAPVGPARICVPLPFTSSQVYVTAVAAPAGRSAALLDDRVLLVKTISVAFPV